MLKLSDYTAAAKEIGCDVATVYACTEVESGKATYYPSGKIVLKFEGHIFHMYTKGKYDQSHPHLSYPKWTEQYSEFGDAAYHRFNEAFNLDPVATLLSTSWGAFQIMGENYSECGFKSVHELVTFLKLSEANNLECFVRYCRTRNLFRYLIAHNWAGYAYRFNGPMYQKNDYPGKLQRAQAKWAKMLNPPMASKAA